MRNFLILTIVVMSLCSCVFHEKYEDTEVFAFEDFPQQEELKGKTLEFDSLIMRPRDIQVFDSILIVVEYGLDELFHVYNLNSKKKISSHIVRGNGPDDMLRPKFIKGPDDKIRVCDMNTFKVCEYELPDFVKQLKPVTSYSVKLDSPPFIGVVELGDKYLSMAYGESNKMLSLFDKDGKKINEMIDYPSSSISYTDAEKRDAYYADIIGDGKNRVAICYSMTDLIEIYNIEGKLLHRIHGPEQFFPYFTEVRKDDVITSFPDKDKTRDAYFSPCTDGDHLFVLYDGDYVNSPENDGSCSYLLVFSWDGKPVANYQLNDPIVSFTISKTQKKIYGVSMIPDFHIVEYSY